jgi:hypothetical protein
MCDWLTQVGEVLRSIRASMRLELLSGDYIQADETPQMLQVPGLGRTTEPICGNIVVLGAALSLTLKWAAAGKGPESSLEIMMGILQTDGPTAIALTTKLEEPRLFGRSVGVMFGASSSRLFRSIRRRSALLS